MTACTTIPRTEPAALPVALQQSFAACQGRDGSARLTIGTATGTLQSDAEWMSRSGGSWDLELTNPIGQPLLLLRYKKDEGNTFGSSGRMAEQIPRLGVDERGFITVDGHFVAIRPEEIPCFFGFLLPSAWLDRTYDYKRENDGLHFTSYDKHRDIYIEARQISRPNEREVCAHISWSEFLGIVRRKGTLCFRGTEKKSATLQGSKGLDVRWHSIGEETHES